MNGGAFHIGGGNQKTFGDIEIVHTWNFEPILEAAERAKTYAGGFGIGGLFDDEMIYGIILSVHFNFNSYLYS